MEKNDHKELVVQLEGLKPYQRRMVEEFLKTMSGVNNIDTQHISNGTMVCKSCGAHEFSKNGTTNGCKRYMCKKCRCTQFADGNTPLHYLQLKEKWPDFVYLMLDSQKPKSCTAMAKELDINYKTAFRWRHRLLSAFNKVAAIELLEETELDEVYFPLCVKGVLGAEKFDEYHGVDHPDNIESEFRIEEKFKEEENFQSVYLCVHNRQGDFDFAPVKVCKKGTASEKEIEKAVVDLNLDLTAKTVITDKEPGMKAFLKSKEDINHLTFKSSDIKSGIMEERNVHNNHINNVAMQLRKWLGSFVGVSTKYLLNYLKWYRFIKKFEIFKLEEFVKHSVMDRQARIRYLNTFGTYVQFVHG